MHLRLTQLLSMYPSFKLGSPPTVEVTGITFDSRKVKPAVVFVAIRGYSHDGYGKMGQKIKDKMRKMGSGMGNLAMVAC